MKASIFLSSYRFQVFAIGILANGFQAGHNTLVEIAHDREDILE